MMLEKEILDRANEWVSSDFDEQTRNEVKYLIDNNPGKLTDVFYRDLEFGTGGLRGIMGVGTNRMNKYTVGMATQGLANYIKKSFPDRKEIKVAIAYDCRNLSDLFARITAEVFSANGIKVYIFDKLRPIPLLSFAIRHLECQSGVVITASHNPKEYNGYKVYWEDGGQLVAPNDKNAMAEIKKITSVKDVNFNKIDENIITIGEEIDKAYFENFKSLIMSPEIISKHKDLKIVFTPIHGASVVLAPAGLKEYGFENIIGVEEQNVVDGNFPTVESPNPEEPAAMEMAMEKGKMVNAHLIMGSDPDGDRVGVIVKNLKNEYVAFNGNQVATIMFYYLLEKYKDKGLFGGNDFVVKTIVTTDLLKNIAYDYDVELFETLTGCKFIADLIRRFEGEKNFIVGGEESYGYMVGDFVRDKDANIACCVIAEIAAWAKENNKTLHELLIDVYIKFGFYKESLISLTKKGKEGYEEIQKMMDDFRSKPPGLINGSSVSEIIDYQKQKHQIIKSGEEYEIKLPKSNVLQILLEDGSKITIRPSGTEPKIKFYFSVNSRLEKHEDYAMIGSQLQQKINAIIKELNIK